jgi:hypothetical protein
VDFSEPSAAALEAALLLAAKFGASVTVMHVQEPPRYIDPSVAIVIGHEESAPLMAYVQGKARSELADLIKAFQRAGSVTIDERVSGATLTAPSSRSPRVAGLIIMKQCRAEAGPLNDIGKSCHAPCPVLTIRGGRHWRAGHTENLNLLAVGPNLLS